MKRATIIAAMLLAVAGCGASSGPTAGMHIASTTPASASGTCSHPFPANPGVTACTYPEGLYSVSYRFEDQYYWHPPKGFFSVAETFYKQNAPGRAAGAWTGRTISVGDSCVISDVWIPSLAHPPADCMDSRDEEMRGATNEEQRSVLAFWHVMSKYIPASER